jgi:hypothetical protein
MAGVGCKAKRIRASSRTGQVGLINLWHATTTRYNIAGHTLKFYDIHVARLPFNVIKRAIKFAGPCWVYCEQWITAKTVYYYTL